MPFFSRIEDGIKRRRLHSVHNQRLVRLAEQIKNCSQTTAGAEAVLIFNASTRLSGVSLNAAYSLLTGWSLSLIGVPVAQLVCESGLKPCVLGTNREAPDTPPPCASCIRQSRAAFQAFEQLPLRFSPDPAFDAKIKDLDLPALEKFQYNGVPLGQLVLPSLRWVLRKYRLEENIKTRTLWTDYLKSAWNIYNESTRIFKQRKFRAVVVFNGMFYPEATVRYAARQAGIPVISHEVGLAPMSGFFTYGDATAYPIHLPDEFQLDDAQNCQLDNYLKNRFQGNFSMAGIRFWSGMEEIPDDLVKKIVSFKQVVPVFTNVIFDTSQEHANVLFASMFEWLEQVVGLIQNHPETLFIIRAHPDETRPGKKSQETVSAWFQHRNLQQLPNVMFIQPHEPLSSYDLILRSKFVMVYNSTIGLEASILGMPVLCGGKARFTQVPTVFFPNSREEHHRLAEQFLDADKVEHPHEYMQNARKFLYYQQFCSSLSFTDFLDEDPYWKGYVLIKEIDLKMLKAEESATIRVILDGILENKSFSKCP